MIEKYGNIEIYIDSNGTYFIIKSYITEKFGSNTYEELPIFERRIYKKEYENIKTNYLREQKLYRILFEY
jgi:hypothetical protein